MIYEQFVTFHCNRCLIVPLNDYANNWIFRKLQKESDYFSSSDERLYIYLRESKGYTDELEKIWRDDSNLVLYTTLLREATNKKVKLRFEYFLGEYIYMFTDKGHCLIVALNDNANNSIFQKLSKESYYFSSSDETRYIDIRDSKGYTDGLEKIRRDNSNLVFYITLTRVATNKKVKLRIFENSPGEYTYMFTDKGRIVKCKTYIVKRVFQRKKIIVIKN